uniref:Uncharacterized protein n=1 Tax=Arundo donax TaxID=35708 RepID=A0A0A8Y9U2_ARUDO
MIYDQVSIINLPALFSSLSHPEQASSGKPPSWQRTSNAVVTSAGILVEDPATYIAASESENNMFNNLALCSFILS